MDEDLIMSYTNKYYYSDAYDYMDIYQTVESLNASTATSTNTVGTQSPITVESIKATLTSLNSTISASPTNYIKWNTQIPIYLDNDYDINTTTATIYQENSDYHYVPMWENSSLYRGCWDSYYTIHRDDTPVSIKRREIKNQLTIIVNSRAQELKKIPKNEWIAMQTLRDMVTETEYRKYIRDGFISVHGQSGKVYQVFRNEAHTKVFFKGELVEEICVRLKRNTPPTDNVIAFKIMIEFDEEYFAALGNRYNMRQAA